MTNVQLYLATGIPVLAVLISMSLSLIQISGIREDMRMMRTEFREDLRGMRDEMRLLRADLTTLTGKVVEIDNRLTRIEERMEHGQS